MRTIAIGDIHGCDTALAGLLDAIAPAFDDTLVFLGDYVDRGPNSKATIQRLIDLKSDCQTVFVRGNHDIVMQQWCEGRLDRSVWETIGGGATLHSYSPVTNPLASDFAEVSPLEIPASHVQFLRDCVDYHQTETHVFVHANYNSSIAIESTSLECLHWCHLRWPLPKPHQSGKIVILGHTPQTNGRIADFGHLVCIDTFCFGGGHLTAYDVDRRSVLQVNPNGRVVRPWDGISEKNWLGRLAARLFMTHSNASTACNQDAASV